MSLYLCNENSNSKLRYCERIVFLQERQYIDVNKTRKIYEKKLPWLNVAHGRFIKKMRYWQQIIYVYSKDVGVQKDVELFLKKNK